MTKLQSVFECIECGFQSPKWLGKCPQCEQWNSFHEDVVEKNKKTTSQGHGPQIIPKKISQILEESGVRIQTGLSEFDRVMGGGITIGSLTLIGGEPGIGKSTILLELLTTLSTRMSSDEILYVSGEESESQISQRAKRLGLKGKDFLILNETRWELIKEVITSKKLKIFVLDSIQTTVSCEIQSAAGSLTQIRDITFDLMNIAKSKGVTCFIVGHVTKDGMIAGPKVLEHMVDTVLYFEGDQFGQYRTLRAIKNRFGNTNEVGIFEMTENGLAAITNPSMHFVDHQNRGGFGRSLSCVVEGSRPVMIEIQALVVENKSGNGRRTTQGYDQNRLAMLIAVIEKYLSIPISFNDIYLNVVGGFKISTRECDLAVIASILSSYLMKPNDLQLILLGEVGLSGEIRNVAQMDVRIKELEQLNYKKVITSDRFLAKKPTKLTFENAGDVKALMKMLFPS